MFGIKRKKTLPKISGYLDRASPARSYDEKELARLQWVYERACEAEGIGLNDPRRSMVASLVFSVANAIKDPSEMLERVIELSKQPIT